MAIADDLPQKIKVGAFDLTVVKWRAVDGATKKLYGEFSALKMEISLDVDTHPPMKVADTLLHEIIHAIYWVWGIEDGDKEERVANMLGTGLVTVFRDNPGLLKWLAKATQSKGF